MGNDYDKIFKENLEALLVSMASHLLNIDLAQTEELPDELQRTIERKPDF